MSISLTPAAAERVRTFMANRGKGIGLRLGVKQTGCSGFAYVVSYADEVGARDVVFEVADVKVVIDTESIKYVDGTKIDVARPGLNEAIKPRKTSVKGDDANPLFATLTELSEEPEWNFAKYLIGRDGKLVSKFPAQTVPEDPEVVAAIDAAL